MGQITVRSSDELLRRVRGAAAAQGRSMNEFVTAILEAATDPSLEGDEAARLRARLAAAGLLVTSAPRRDRPPADRVAAARAAAGAGKSLSDLVGEGRR